MSDFHLLLEEQIPRLMRYAAALTRDADAAGDLVEDTVREALAAQRRWRGGNIRTWLLAILHELRDNPFRQANLAASGAACDPAAALTLSDLDRALGQLPEELRAIVLLVGLEGLSYADTAAVLAIPAGTMRARLARARAGLRLALGFPQPARIARAA